MAISRFFTIAALIVIFFATLGPTAKANDPADPETNPFATPRQQIIYDFEWTYEHFKSALKALEETLDPKDHASIAETLARSASLAGHIAAASAPLAVV